MLTGLLLVSGAAQAQFAIVGHYTNDADALDVFTNVSASGKAAGIGMQRKVSISVSKIEWSKVVALWQKAKASQGSSFQVVGSLTEANTKDPSTLTLAAGPGVRFTINQPAYPGSTNEPGTYSLLLLPKDFARFDADLAKVVAFLNSN